MPSSPEVVPAAAPAMTVWEPVELGHTATNGLPTVSAMQPRAIVTKPFEVADAAGIPEAVLAPAREAATNAGYVNGWNRGHKAGIAAAAAEAARDRAFAEQVVAAKLAELESAAEALRTAARKLDAREATSADQVERLIIDSALEIAESLVGLNLSDDADRGRAAVARALALAPGKSHVTVGLSPADAEIMRDTQLRPGVELMVDPSLAPGDSYARWGVTTADTRITTGMARVRDLLAPTATALPAGKPQLGIA